MSPQLQSEPISYQQQKPEWNPALRVAFRFSVAYLGLFCAATQIVTSLFSATQGSDIPDPATLWPLRPLVVWTAGHIFHVAVPLPLEGNSASGDCMFGWVTAFCLLVVAAFVTVIWSVLDRKRKNYAALHKWVPASSFVLCLPDRCSITAWPRSSRCKCRILHWPGCCSPSAPSLPWACSGVQSALLQLMKFSPVARKSSAACC